MKFRAAGAAVLVGLLQAAGQVTDQAAGAQGQKTVAQPVHAAASAVAAPGVPLPAKGMVWVLDTANGRQALAQLKFHPTIVNDHVARNLLMPPLVPTKGTIELNGNQSAARVTNAQPSLFVRSHADREDELDISADPARIVLVQMRAVGQRRAMTRMSFNYIGTMRSRTQETIDVTETSLMNGEWTELTPQQPLAAGEYALVFLPKQRRKNWVPRTVVDFGVGNAVK